MNRRVAEAILLLILAGCEAPPPISAIGIPYVQDRPRPTQSVDEQIQAAERQGVVKGEIELCPTAR